MAVTLVVLSGKVLAPDGVAITSGNIRAKLSPVPGSTLDGTVSQRVATEANGTITAGTVAMSICPNDAITPSGTYYVAVYDCKAANGKAYRWSEKWQLDSSDLTLDIGAVPRLDVVPGVAVGVNFSPLGGDLSLATATATGTGMARTMAGWVADQIPGGWNYHRQRARDLAPELAALKAEMAQLKSALLTPDTAETALRVRFAPATSAGPTGLYPAVGQLLKGTKGETISFTRSGVVQNDQYDPQYMNGYYQVGADYIPLTPRGALFEPAGTGYFLNSTTPATQTVTLANGWHHAFGPHIGGKDWEVTLTAGTAVSAQLPCVVTRHNIGKFKVTTPGTVVVTVGTPAPSHFFVQTGAYRSTPILCTGATATRSEPVMSVPNPLTNPDVNWTVGCTFNTRQPVGSLRDEENGNVRGLWRIGAAGATSNTAVLHTATNLLQFSVYDAAFGIRYIQHPLNAGLAPGPHTVHCCSANGTLTMFIDGVQVSTAPAGAGTGIIGTQPANIEIGRWSAGTGWFGDLYELVVGKAIGPLAVPLRVPFQAGVDRMQTSVGNTVVLIGDSITAQNDDFGRDDGYWSWANVLMHHRFRVVGYAGVGGDTTVGAIGRVFSQVVARQPTFAVICIGVNDLPGGVARATSLANIQDMANRCLAAGITPVVSTLPPSTTFDATMGANWLWLNDQIRTWCATTPGVVLADMGVANSGTPAYNPASGTTRDGIHPNALGAGNMGVVLAAAMKDLAPRLEADFTSLNDDPLNVLWLNCDPFMVNVGGTATPGGGSITGVVPFGWELKANGATLVTSQVARTDGRPGKWFQIEVTGGTPTGDIELVAVATTNVGKDATYLAQCEFEAESWVGCKSFQLLGETRSSGDTPYGFTYDLKEYADDPDRVTPASGVLRTVPAVPAQYNGNPSTKLAFRLTWRCTTGKLRVGRCEFKMASRMV
jgi:lysophospholipase L1-like esterase